MKGKKKERKKDRKDYRLHFVSWINMSENDELREWKPENF